MNNKYQLNTSENRIFLNNMRNNLLAFGRRFPANTGSSYYLDHDGSPCKDKPRQTWITARMAHVYSIGTLLGDTNSKALAQAAINGLLGELHDTEYGGWYAAINADSTIIGDKQCYAHAFVILAATSAILANINGAQKLLDLAIQTYEKYFFDDSIGLSCDLYNRDFSILDDYRGINANMHSVEAFLALADAAKIHPNIDSYLDNTYRKRAGRVIDHILKWASQNNWRIPEHFSKDWQMQLEFNKDKPDDPFKPYGATPGHGMEWSRLIAQYALSANISNKDEYINASIKLYQRAFSDAWNCDGYKGFVYTTDWNGAPIVHDRMHWTLAEGINTASLLYHITNTDRYKDEYYEFMHYLDTSVLDHKYGSWYHQLDMTNRKVIDKVWSGKPDIYHAIQAVLIPMLPPDISIASALFKGGVEKLQ